MLVGTYRNTVDAKFRAIIPSDFRDDLGPKVVLTLNIDKPKCVRVYTLEKYQELINRLGEAKLNGADIRGVERCLVDPAKFIDLDAQSRFVIPPELRQRANITKEFCTVGKIGYVELWDKATYDALEDSFDHNNSIEVARSLGIL